MFLMLFGGRQIAHLQCDAATLAERRGHGVQCIAPQCYAPLPKLRVGLQPPAQHPSKGHSATQNGSRYHLAVTCTLNNMALSELDVASCIIYLRSHRRPNQT